MEPNNSDATAAMQPNNSDITAAIRALTRAGVISWHQEADFLEAKFEPTTLREVEDDEGVLHYLLTIHAGEGDDEGQEYEDDITKQIFSKYIDYSKGNLDVQVTQR